MHNLVIDIGNSFSKIAVFQGRELIKFIRVVKLDQPLLADIIQQYDVKNATLASVAKPADELISFLRKVVNYHPFSTKLNNGISSNYQTEETLGLDRWAKVLAGHSLYPNQNCLLIDAGTCITYDWLSHRAVYLGGSISLGIQMRFKALNHYTQRLPLVPMHTLPDEIPTGTDTKTAIINGVLQGVVNEVEGWIRQQQEKNKNPKVVLTGGDADFLSKQLKNSIFAPQISVDPYLVLRGLNEVITIAYV